MLQYSFADLDEVITTKCGKAPPLIVAEQGWDAFRSMEVEALLEAIAGEHTGHQPAVVACGGGIIETDRGLEILKAHWPVIFNERHIDDVVEYLVGGGGLGQAHRATLGEHPSVTYARRLPRYIQCADFWLPQLRGEAEPEHPSRLLANLLKMVTAPRGDSVCSSGIHLGVDTFLLSLPSEDLMPASNTRQEDLQQAQLLREVSLGADVIELRVDLLASQEASFVARQVAILRRYAGGASLLYTVRSKTHGGAFDGSEEEYVALLHMGLRLGCEFIDLERTRSQESIDSIMSESKGNQLVCSHHEGERTTQSGAAESLLRRCSLNGAASVAKIWTSPSQAGSRTTPSGLDFVAFFLGEERKLSTRQIDIVQLSTKLMHRLSCVVPEVLKPTSCTLQVPALCQQPPTPSAASFSKELEGHDAKQMIGLVILPDGALPVGSTAQAAQLALAELSRAHSCGGPGIRVFVYGPKEVSDADTPGAIRIRAMKDLANIALFPRLDIVMLVGGVAPGDTSGALEAELKRRKLSPAIA